MLELKIGIGTEPIRPWKGSDESVVEFLQDFCTHLADAGHVVFRVSGFGDDAWPVDVETDLAVVLEQLPEVIRLLERESEATLDFYEQGVERVVHFEPEPPLTLLTCTSGTHWQPSPASVQIPSDELLAHLIDLRSTFVELVESSLSGGNAAFDAWRTR